jgi:hypothetical protein
MVFGQVCELAASQETCPGDFAGCDEIEIRDEAGIGLGKFGLAGDRLGLTPGLIPSSSLFNYRDSKGRESTANQHRQSIEELISGLTLDWYGISRLPVTLPVAH